MYVCLGEGGGVERKGKKRQKALSTPIDQPDVL